MTDEIDNPAFPTGRSAVGVHAEIVDGVAVLAVTDVVDAATAPQLSSAVDEAFAGAPSGLVLDLTDVNFLGSAGMTILMKAKERAGDNVGFAVVAVGNATRRPMTVLGLDAELPLYDTRDEALRSVRG
ncbi:anti-anti-sigma factor [Mycolicibacterium iranicum]|uniref:Anti-sigma factor antagonist n=1 Tax=Mycolicibacterium iranicum TaxID=912594 RepID=A0A839Q7E9_MYCIR|nr:STAS domain-containing protein [Mycolicibacterium iranicum]MBB2990325.1 anti-anti-sigma factor [Mycolicibacterium iranicum]